MTNKEGVAGGVGTTATVEIYAESDGNASFLRAARAGNIDKILEYLKGSIDINTSNANGLNALHLSSKEGHVSVVTELVKKGANVNVATKKGNTALHIASLAGQEEVVKILVRNGANVNVQSQNGFTPLYMAAQENHDNVVKFLLSNGANQNLATEDGFTPLAVALQQGHDKVVAVLLENDAKGRVRLPALHIAAKKDDCKAAALLLQNDHDPDVTSKSGFTPLHIAAHYGNKNIGALLLEKNADVNYSAKHQITPLHVAAKWGKSNMVTLLVDKGAKIDASTRDGLTPLHCAARSGHDQVVDLLLERGAPITAKTKNGLAPLHMASQGDHADSARILLYHKAPVDDVTVDYLTALHVAAHCGHVRVAKLLLDRKADPNARALNGFTPLHIACKKNRIKVVELLLKHGASIEATTESGLTPLHVASFMGCMNIVIYLIQHGANPDVPTVRGETPLHLAARANQSDIIRILLRNGAHVDASAREHQTPLHIAARLGNVDIVGLLLQHGAAVDATTKDMYTALHIAAKEGQEEVASVLLDHGASLTATTKKGFTPLHLAAKYGNIKVARLLLQKDAPVDSQGKNGVTPLHVASHYDHVNVALLLLDKGAYPHATAKNGYTPLHIAAKKNQMDIATTLLEYGAKSNAESKAGFTPLHLAAQEGHTDMTTLLIEHHADPGAPAKNLLTPLHLCAQEDRVNVAAILVKNGADIGPHTKAGYTPLHVACHFGQMNMIRFLLQHGADVNATTSHGYTPLHQAAQQGHTLIINLLLEHKASPNTTTSLGQTALSIAQRLGYVSVVETLKIVTETVVTTTTTTITEEKYKVVTPETMQETFMSDSEDEGGDDIEDTTLYGKPAHATHVYLPYIEGQRLLTTEDTMLGDQSFRYLTADEMKSLGDDSLPIDVTRDERIDSLLSAPLTAEEDHLTPQHIVNQEAFSTSMTVDNIELARAPVHAGFLVSFMVDARGGAMRGCRHSGVRVIIPPRKAPMPMRITCRYLRKEKLAHPPPLMEGEACASRILEVGPSGAKFLGPVIIEVPHFAAMRGREREITILRSDNGESWREHTLEASDDAVHDVFNESFEGEELTALDDLNTNRITRIMTTDFPQYFAVITRIRQEVHAIGPEGGMVSSTVVPQVQAIFPEGALTKKIKVGLQAQPITPELVTKMLGNRVAVSPIVTVEPRRRKFHKPITLTIPVPQAATKGMINQYSGDAPTLRLLCSITGSTKTGGTTKAQWEDVTGSTPLTFVNDCVSFTTTVSARFWLMDCRQVTEATKFATELYREAIHVPFMAKFVVFAKRYDPLEAQLRVFCMTDDKEDKTLESQEHFSEVAKSRDVEVLEAKYQFLEFAGNLVPVTKSGEQLSLAFQAFRENRLPFTIRVKDPHQEPLGRVAFMREPRVGRGEPPQTPICNLNIALPDAQLTPVSELVTLEKKYGFVEETGLANPELIHRADLRLSDIAKELRDDWVPLALQLDVPEIDIHSIKSECPDNVNQQALVMLRHWLQRAGSKATGNSLEKALRKINREDIVNQCMFNVELVTDDVEKAVAKVHLDQSGFDTFKEELGSSRDTSLRRDASLNGTLEERDIMKEAESAAETSSESSDKDAHFKSEIIEQQITQETESEDQDAKDVDFFVREAVRTPESTLVEQTFAKAVPAIFTELFAHDITNGQSTVQEEDKSEPTTATISSEATAELEISSSEEKPVKETVTEKKDFSSGTMSSAAIKLLPDENLATATTASRRGNLSIGAKNSKHIGSYKEGKTGIKKVSFDVNYRTLSPSPSSQQKKKKALTRQGSWPPTTIPGQRSKKKKQKKYFRALRNVRVLSPDVNCSNGLIQIRDSYEWLLSQAEPEAFPDAPLAVSEDLTEEIPSAEIIPFLDSTSLQQYIECQSVIPNTKKMSGKTRCGEPLASYLMGDSSMSILCDGSNYVTQELARTSALRKRDALRSLRQHFALPLKSSFNSTYDSCDNPLAESSSDISFSPSIFPHDSKSIQATPIYDKNMFTPSVVQSETSSVDSYSIYEITCPINKENPSPKKVFINSKFRVKSTPNQDSQQKSQSYSLGHEPIRLVGSSSQDNSTTMFLTDVTSQSESCTTSSTALPLQQAVFPSSADVTDSNSNKKDGKKLLSEKPKEHDSDATIGKLFLKSLTGILPEDETSNNVIPASVVGQAFLKTLTMHEMLVDNYRKVTVSEIAAEGEPITTDNNNSDTQSIPASIIGKEFLKSLLERTNHDEIKEFVSATGEDVSRLSTGKLPITQSGELDKVISAPVVEQVSLKSLGDSPPSICGALSDDETVMPASVLSQTFLKSLLEQSFEVENVRKVDKVIPQSIVVQQKEFASESKKVVPSNVLEQSFLKSLLQNQAKETGLKHESDSPIPAAVIGQSFLKSLIEQVVNVGNEWDKTSLSSYSFKQETVEKSTEEMEKIIPSTVIGQSFLKSLVQQTYIPEKENFIPVTVVEHSADHQLCNVESAKSYIYGPDSSTKQDCLISFTEQSPMSEKSTENKVITASAIGHIFLKSLLDQPLSSVSENSHSKDTVPSAMVGQSFNKSLLQQSFSPDSIETIKAEPTSFAGATSLESCVEQPLTKSSKLKDAIPATVIGQSFLKSLMQETSASSAGLVDNPIPASVIGQAFLKSLVEKPISVAENSKPEGTMSSAVTSEVVSNYFSGSSPVNHSETKNVIPATVGQTFLKFLFEQQQSKDENAKCQLIPAPVVSQSFLKSLVEQSQTSEKNTAFKTVVPEMTVSQPSNKSFAEQSSTKSNKEDKQIPAPVIGQCFLKELVEQLQMVDESLDSNQVIPPTVVGQTSLKSLTEKQLPSISNSHNEKKVVTKEVVEKKNVTGEILTPLISDQMLGVVSEEKVVVPAPVVGQTFLRSLMEHQSSSTCYDAEKFVPASVIGQTFLKSLVDQSNISSIVETGGESDPEKILPAAVLGQAFLKALSELRGNDDISPAPAHILLESPKTGSTFINTSQQTLNSSCVEYTEPALTEKTISSSCGAKSEPDAHQKFSFETALSGGTDNCDPEWTETDEAGSVKQITEIKTETSIKVSGDDIESGDDDVLSRTTTTTTTRIVTTVTTGDEVEGGDQLRSSMEAVLNQFLSEDAPPQEQSSQPH